MRIKSLFMAFLAGALALVACKKEQNPNDLPPSITVTPASVEFDQSEGSKKLEVKATRDWTISGIPEWIAVTPASGQAGLNASEVTISVLANTGNDREAKLSFSIGLAKQAVTVKQKGAKGEIDNGKGTKESPYSVAGAVAFIQTLGSDVESTEKIYIKGKISTVETTFGASGNYGNATFNMVDEAGSDVVFKAFQTYYLGNRKWKTGDTEVKEGDEVIIYGPVVNYKGNTPETVGKGASFIYSLNGVTDGGDDPGTGGEPKGSGTQEDPYNVAAALNAVKDLTWTANDNYQKVGPFYVKGKISKIADNGTYSQSGSYGNATFYISDDGTQNGEFYCYRLLYLGNKKYTSGTDIKVGDEVIIYGELMNYRGNTPETVSNSAHLYSLNGVTGGDDPGPGPGGEVQQITCAEFIQKADQNTVYRLVGEVTSDVNTSYCSFDMNDGTATVVVWTVNNKDEWKDVVKKGGTVTVRGKYQPYTDKNGNLKHEMVDAYIEDFKAGGTPDPGSDDKPSGNGTLDSPYNPKAAYDIAAALASDAKSDDVYITGKISSIKYTFSAEYGTATFNISEDGSTSGTQLPCYSVYYLGNRAWTNGDTQVAVGDKVIIYGKLTNYQGNTPETASKNAYIYSLNGKTGGDDPGPGPGPDPGTPSGNGTQADPYNVAAALNAVKDFTWTDNNTYDKTGQVYVKGKISRVANKGTFSESGDYGNASFYISDDGSQNNEFYCFRILYFNSEKYTSGTDIKVGDNVIIYGELMNYKGNTPETVSGKACLYSLNGATGGDTPGPGPGPDPMAVKEVTVAQFIAAQEDVVQKYQLTGKVTDIQNTTYGNFTLKDDTGEVYVYGLTATEQVWDKENKKINNDKSFASLNLTEGDTITIIGYRIDFNGKPEVAGAYFVEKVAGGDTPGPGPDPGEGNTVTFTYESADGIPVTTNGEACSTTLGAVTIQLEAGARNEKNQDIRIYKGKKMTISTTASNITKIVITSKGGDNGADKFGEGVPSGYSATATSGTWTGSSTSVAFTASGAQVRMLSIEVTYE